MYQFGEEEHTVLQEACIEEVQEDTNLDRVEAHKWSQALTFHHQWMVLSREHAAAVVKLRTEITVVSRVKELSEVWVCLLQSRCCSCCAVMQRTLI